MKLARYIYAASIFLIGSTVANAGWNPTTIEFVQMPISANVVYVYFDTKISLDSCPNANAKVVQGAILRTNEPNFDEMYARLLIAEQNNETIQVLSSSGTCTSGVWVETPYIRFGN